VSASFVRIHSGQEKIAIFQKVNFWKIGIIVLEENNSGKSQIN